MTARAEPDTTPNDASSPEEREESLVAIESDVPRRGGNATQRPQKSRKKSSSRDSCLRTPVASSRSIEEDVPTLTGSPRQQSHPRAPCASTCSKWTCRRFVARSPRRRARVSSARVARARARPSRRSRRRPATTTTAHPPKRSRTTRVVASSLWDARSSRSCPTLARRTPGFCRTSSPPRPSPVLADFDSTTARLGFRFSIPRVGACCAIASKRHRRRRLRHHREDRRGGIQQTADERTRRGRGRRRGRPPGTGTRGRSRRTRASRIRSLFGGSR